MQSRRGADVTGAFPDLAKAAAAPQEDLVVDGELVAVLNEGPCSWPPRWRARCWQCAVSGVVVGGSAAAAAHVGDFGDLGACQARGQWYLANGGNVQRYECRSAGVWQLWVLTGGSCGPESVV
ncbi:hypothetical protein AB0I49_26790 [Streptomyces sp. NPDC050617]|uniref:hypothetical protein n=1 Tax=Streptomyces sp. NPDC050617 TaxID=3154628 RepID=UPI0034266468